MSWLKDPKIMVAVIAAAASVLAGTFTILGQQEVARKEEQFRIAMEGHDFLAKTLTDLYVPVSQHLKATRALIGRYSEESTGPEERVAIEHEMHRHNQIIRKCLMESSAYILPDAPEQFTDELLEHLIQWQIVYSLKYEHGAYDGPVMAGVAKFGYRGFPRQTVNGQSIDEFWAETTRSLRGRLHSLRGTRR